jgi:hypothetical protein
VLPSARRQFYDWSQNCEIWQRASPLTIGKGKGFCWQHSCWLNCSAARMSEVLPVMQRLREPHDVAKSRSQR